MSRRFLLLLSCFALAFPHAVTLEQCVSVRVTNCHGRLVTGAFGPVTLCAEARVQPDEQHRYLVFEMDYAPPDWMPDISDDDTPLREIDAQDGVVPGSEIQLDGANERIRHERKYRHLSGGQYEVRATVYDDEARKKVCGRATARVTVR